MDVADDWTAQCTITPDPPVTGDYSRRGRYRLAGLHSVDRDLYAPGRSKLPPGIWDNGGKNLGERDLTKPADVTGNSYIRIH